jgi:gamma-glutamylcyclotransferase (GGCT)/AIG2-like uncharacterized protein YtfP
MKRLLVYGSLRRGHRAHRSLEIRHAQFIKEVRVPGFDLLALGWYPGIKANPENKDGFLGELYAIPDHLWDELIQHLDYYEGYFPDNLERSLFLRTEIEIEGHPTTVYTYNGKTNNELVVKVQSGDWNAA